MNGSTPEPPDEAVNASPNERFADLCRLASIQSSLDRLPFLPGDEGIAKRRVELNGELTEIAARLSVESNPR